MNRYDDIDELKAITEVFKKGIVPEKQVLDELHAALLAKQKTNLEDPDYKLTPWLKGLSSGTESNCLTTLNNLGTDSPDIIRALRAAIFSHPLSYEDAERFFGKYERTKGV